MRIVAGVVMAMVCSAAAFATEPVQRTLSFDDRVKAQGAIERVYYSHQLGTTKLFADAVPRAVLEAKVHKYLEQSAALSSYWKTAITDYTLQRELERMAQGTKMPERLIELYAALGNDPFLIKECLARPALVDRLTHNFYAFDPTQHVKERGQADALHQMLVSGALSPSTENPNRTVTELVVSETESGPARPEQASQQRVSPSDFQKKRGELPAHSGEVSDIEEPRESYVFSVVLSETATNVRVGNYVVPKITWDTWWEIARRTVRSDSVMAVASGLVDLPAPRQGDSSDRQPSVVGDVWDNGSLDALPQGREVHTAVWTGSVMVVWGGASGVSDSHWVGLDSGSRYDPATDTWTPTSTVDAPTPRSLHRAVWTGTRMIVWGGVDNVGQMLNTGGLYDPVADIWSPTSEVGAPIGRDLHTAVWTGSEMIVWGGYLGASPYSTNSGGRYDPTSDTWTPTSITGAPSPRDSHSAVWTGTEMLIWGGGYFLATGGRYDPASNTWTSMSTAGAPSGRVYHTAVWTGRVMVIWGGADAGNTGGRYDPVTDTWSTMSIINAPPPGNAGGGHTAVWTGTVMIVWGMYDVNGSHRTGGRYDPVADTWVATSLTGAPSGRANHTAVWTGTEMIVWGGRTYDSNTGGRYDPTVDSWTPTTTAGAPSARYDQTAVWTGSLMVVWGGDYYDNQLLSVGTGGRYDPATDNWTPTTTTGAPTPRRYHTASWTGARMIVWGGLGNDDDQGFVNTGGLYDPVADTWTPTSVVAAPVPRGQHTAVWTGNSLVVWGGYTYYDGLGELNTGGRYDPDSNTWTVTSLLGAPSPREGHTATWTGSEMIIWGGRGVFPSEYYLISGGRYDPILGTWTETSVDGAPEARSGHTAVWANGEVVIWGGGGGRNPAEVNSGGRYDPSTNVWRPTSLAGAPTPRRDHSAVWTGTEMIVWGGYDNTGGRYSPVANLWTATTTVGAPAGRGGHSAVWTGNMMLVWGGGNNTGGRYRPGTGTGYVCDDSNLCSDDTFDPATGCVFTPNTNACNDSNACTTNDTCHNYSCSGTPITGTACNDGDACTTGDSCVGGTCHGGPRLNCDDGNACNGSERCDSGYGCLSGVPLSCDDGNACTTDLCSPTAGCVHSGIECDDSDLCTTDTCDPASGCVFVNDAGVCNDNNPCTDDSCDPATGACSNVNDDNNSCSDNSLCTQTDTCYAGVCTGSNPVQCETGCPAGFTTVGGLCQKTYNIDAGLLENLPTYCDESGTSLFNDCNGQNYGFHWTDQAHTVAAVSNVELQFEPGLNCGGSFSGLSLNGAPVGGFDPDENCDCESIQGTISIPNLDVSAYAMGGVNVISIAPGSACEGLSTSDELGGAFARITVTYMPYSHICQVGVCDPGTGACNFSMAPNGTECTDGNACTTGDSCIDGACNGTTLDCNDNNLCTDDSCDPELGCVTVRAPAGRSCDDHNACDGAEACDAYGTCVSSNPPQCDDHVVCTEDSCDPALGCVYRPYPAGTSCADGDPCNGVEHCDGTGQCASGGPTNCDDNNPCTDDSCDPAIGCVHTNNSNICDDRNACTAGDTCGGGACHGGAPLVCDDNNPCTDDSCDPTTGCVHTNNTAACNDGNACTTGDTCGGGTCRGGAPLVCSDGNPCTDDSCDPTTGCVHTNNTAACNDGNACTTGDHCAGGTCSAGAPVTCNALDQCHTAGACNPATGACSNPVKPNGTVCDDASWCTTGETCQSGICAPGASGLNEPNPRTNGYYKRLCQGPHSGDQFRDADATCVASVAETFAGVTTVADLCGVLQPSHPNSDPCAKTEVDLMVLALNICRARVCTAQSIDSQCGGNGSVAQSLAESDDILQGETRNGTSCAHAKCLDEEINTGRALELDTLTLRREGSAIRLDWHPPYLDDGTDHPSKYNVWRRTQGSLAAFTKIGTTTEATFVDLLAASAAFEYEVTAVMN